MTLSFIPLQRHMILTSTLGDIVTHLITSLCFIAWDEYAQMIVMQMRYCHINLGILDTFTALPTTMPCPKVDGI